MNPDSLKQGQEAYKACLDGFKKAQEGKSAIEKIEGAYAYLLETSTPCAEKETPSSSTAYGALVEKKADRFGYAKALQALLKHVDVPAISVEGYRLSAKGYYESAYYNKVQARRQMVLDRRRNLRFG